LLTHTSRQIAGLISTNISRGYDDEKLAFESMLHGIRRQPLYKYAPIVLIVESVAGTEGSRMEAWARSDPLVFSIRECNKGKRAGVGKAEAEDMTHMLTDRLTRKTLVYADIFITYDKDKQTVKDILKRQMNNYQWHPDKTGKMKLDGKVGGMNDDLLITTMMIPWWSGVFLGSQRLAYIQFKQLHNL